MLLQRINAIEKAEKLKLSKKMISTASGVPHPRVSDYFNGNRLPDAQESKVTETIQQIAFVHEVFSPFRIDLSSPELLAAAVENARNEKTRRESAELENQLTNIFEDIKSDGQGIFA